MRGWVSFEGLQVVPFELMELHDEGQRPKHVIDAITDGYSVFVEDIQLLCPGFYCLCDFTCF